MAGLPNQAWVTSVLRDEDVPGALCVYFSLKSVLTSRKVVVVVSNQISFFNMRILFHAFDQLIFLNEKWNTAGLKLDEFVKLFTLTLKSLESYTYLSPTNVVIKNCDDLFNYKNFPTGFLWMQDEELSFFFGRPSLKTFDDLLTLLSANGRSAGSILKTWAETKFGYTNFFEGFHSRVHTEVNCMQMNASIYNVSEINFDKEFENMGLLPNMILKIRNQIYKNYVQPLFESLNPNHLLVASAPHQLPTYVNEPIAIVGMSCRYPGANNIDEFWNILFKGKDAIGNPPDFRWLPEQSTKKESHFRKTRAGFLKCPVDEFDAKFFGISPHEVSFMDPQQRILHELVWEGLENAAINPQSLKGSMGGVFVGSWANEFKDILTANGNPEFFRTYMGNSMGNTAARISFLLGLTGPSIATESGCSSSMVAVHLACKSLRGRESSIALACGINLILEPFDHLKMELALSPDGQCKTFDTKANGFARSEGVGVLVLKRLSDAVRNEDRIWGLIRGTAMTQEGLSKSIGTPTVNCEALAMKNALNDAEIDPSLVSYVEAHGTGTAVGDPIEVRAIAEAYHSELRTEPLLIGSVKTNIGHTESCAGIAGIMKVILAMKHELIPAHRNFDVLNPAIDLDAVPAKIPLVAQQWGKVSGKSRFAGISSFGITGTDAHAIIEEPPIKPFEGFATTKDFERPLHPMKISAASEEALDILVRRYKAMLTDSEDDFEDLAFTSNVGRADFSQRMIIVAKSKEDAIQIIENNKFMKAEVSVGSSRKICFLFPGQGSQYPGMAKQLFETSPVFRIHFEYCATILNQTYGINITQVLWSSDESDSKEIGRTIYSQTSIFCVEYALLKLWETWGLKPDYVLGHSLGEFAAAVCAGILSVEDALKLVAERSLLIEKLAQGKMLVVKLDKSAVDTFLKEFADGIENKILDIAAINSNEQTVIAGDSELILKCAKRLNQIGIKNTPLETTHAFHSKQMDAILEEYKKVAKSIKIVARQEGNCKFISGMIGSVIDASDVNVEYWVQHVRQPVLFLEASKTAISLGCTIFIEIGPQPVLSGLMRAEKGVGRDLLILPSLRRSQMDWLTLLNTFGTLYVNGMEFDWEGFEKFYGRRKVTTVPNYPFIRKKYWPNLKNFTGTKIHPLLGSAVPNASAVNIFECGINTRELEYLRDYVVGSNVIFPIAGFLELALAAGFTASQGLTGDFHRPNNPMKITNLVIKSQLSLQDNETCQLQTVVDFEKGSKWDELQIKIYRRSDSEDLKWFPHANARFSNFVDWNEKEVDFDREQFIKTLETPATDVVIPEFYEKLASIGLKFGSAFRSIEKVWMNESTGVILSKIKILFGNGPISTGYIVHPVFLDGMLQIMRMLVPISNSKKGIYLPIKIGNFVWLSEVNTSEIYVQAWTNKSGSVSAFLLDESGKIIATMLDVEFLETSVKAMQSILDQQLNPLSQFYEEVWQKTFSNSENSITLPKASGSYFDAEFCKAFQSKCNSVPELLNATFRSMQELAYYNFLKAFYQLGWKPEVGKQYDEAELLCWLRIEPKFRKYFTYICELFESKGIFKRVNETSWSVLKNPPSYKTLLALLGSTEFSCDLVQAFRSTLLLQNVGENLSDVLKGRISAVSLLFSQDNQGILPSMADLYDEYFELFQFKNNFQMLAQQILRKIQDFQTKPLFKFRILEVGAGTGAFSHIFMDLLDSRGILFDYTYTDISTAFFRGAEQKFRKYENSIKFTKLNLEEDPIIQGFIPGYYDIVVAAEVIHATKNIVESLQNIRILMKENGLLLIQEATRPLPSSMLVAGALDGYWRFEDSELRKKTCMLSKDKWENVLQHNGLQVEASFSELYDNHALICCMKLSNFSKNQNSSVKTWLVFHQPGHPVSAHLCQKIPRKVIKITTGKTYREDLKNNLVVIRKENYKDFHKLLTGLLNRGFELEGIVYCWALNKTMTSQEELLQPYFNLTKCIITLDMCSYLRLSLVTNGVVSLGENCPFHYHANTLWGYSKSLKNEQMNLNCRCIDIVDELVDEETMDLLFYEIWSTDKENQVAISNGSRHVPRLALVPFNINSLELPKGTNRFQLLLHNSKSISDLKFVPLYKQDLKEEEVEIHVKAFGLNIVDVLNALKPLKQFTNPIASDFSGVVTRIGAEVTRWNIGDSVHGVSTDSTALQSHITVKQSLLISKPKTMTFSEAVTIPVAYITALYGLMEVANIKKEDVVLIHSATGSVGLAAIEICKYIGCTIIAMVESKRKENYLSGLGISNIFSSRNPEFGKEILKLTGGKGVNVVFNWLKTGKDFKGISLEACAKGARFVEMSQRNIRDEEVQRQRLRTDVQYTVIDISKWSTEEWTKYFSNLKDLMKKKVVKPIPLVRFNGEDIQQALIFMENAKHIGKVVIKMPIRRREETGMKIYNPMFNGESTYLITGGLGGIGLVVCEWMVNNGAVNILLGSRGLPSSAALTKIHDMKSNGANIIVVQLDVGDFEECKELIKIKLKALALPPLRGVMHSAGILSDSSVQNLDWNKLSSTFRSKIEGTLNLHEITKDMNLEHFVLFSSVVSLLGTPGQSSHASACAFEDGFAHYRHSLGLPATTINWGQWAEVGVAKENDLLGLKPLPNLQGIQGLENVLRLNRLQTSITTIDSIFLLSKVVPQLSTYIEDGVWNSSVKKCRQLTLNSVEFWERYDSLKVAREKQEFLKEQLQTILRNTMRLDETDGVDEHANLQALGMDSLMVVEMRNWIQTLMGDSISINSNSISDFSTINNIAESLTMLMAGKNSNLECKPEPNFIMDCNNNYQEISLTTEMRFPLAHTIHYPMGKENQVPLFIASCFFGVMSDWDSIAEIIAQETNRKVITFDARSHGDSDFYTDLSYELMADDIFLLAKHLNLENISIMGHSLGGKTGMVFALKYPDILEELVVVDISPLEEHYDSPHFIKCLEILRTLIVTAEPSVSLADFKHKADVALTTLGCIPETRAYLLANVIENNGKKFWTARPSLDVFLLNYPEIRKFPNSFLSYKYNKPALFIKGENSTYVPFDAFEKIRKIFTKAEFKVIEKAGHFPQVSNFKGFMDALLPFLRGKTSQPFLSI